MVGPRGREAAAQSLGSDHLSDAHVAFLLFNITRRVRARTHVAGLVFESTGVVHYRTVREVYN